MPQGTINSSHSSIGNWVSCLHDWLLFANAINYSQLSQLIALRNLTNPTSLIFKKSQKPWKLEGFCDLDWRNLDDRKSVSRFCFRLAENNPMISWKSKKQNSVALSTCKVEFIAISLASQEALYLRALLRTMTELESLKNLTTIHCDNQSSIVLEKKSSCSSKIKTYWYKISFFKWWNKGSILLEYIATREKNVTDVFMKPMMGIKLNTLKKIIVANWFLT